MPDIPSLSPLLPSKTNLTADDSCQASTLYNIKKALRNLDAFMVLSGEQQYDSKYIYTKSTNDTFYFKTKGGYHAEALSLPLAVATITESSHEQLHTVLTSDSNHDLLLLPPHSPNSVLSRYLHCCPPELYRSAAEQLHSHPSPIARWIGMQLTHSIEQLECRNPSEVDTARWEESRRFHNQLRSYFLGHDGALAACLQSGSDMALQAARLSIMQDEGRDLVDALCPSYGKVAVWATPQLIKDAAALLLEQGHTASSLFLFRSALEGGAVPCGSEEAAGALCLLYDIAHQPARLRLMELLLQENGQDIEDSQLADRRWVQLEDLLDEALNNSDITSKKEASRKCLLAAACAMQRWEAPLTPERSANLRKAALLANRHDNREMFDTICSSEVLYSELLRLLKEETQLRASYLSEGKNTKPTRLLFELADNVLESPQKHFGDATVEQLIELLLEKNATEKTLEKVEQLLRGVRMAGEQQWKRLLATEETPKIKDVLAKIRRGFLEEPPLFNCNDMKECWTILRGVLTSFDGLMELLQSPCLTMMEEAFAYQEMVDLAGKTLKLASKMSPKEQTTHSQNIRALLANELPPEGELSSAEALKRLEPLFGQLKLKRTLADDFDNVLKLIQKTPKEVSRLTDLLKRAGADKAPEWGGSLAALARYCRTKSITPYDWLTVAELLIKSGQADAMEEAAAHLLHILAKPACLNVPAGKGKKKKPAAQPPSNKERFKANLGALISYGALTPACVATVNECLQHHHIGTYYKPEEITHHRSSLALPEATERLRQALLNPQTPLEEILASLEHRLALGSFDITANFQWFSPLNSRSISSAGEAAAYAEIADLLMVSMRAAWQKEPTDERESNCRRIVDMILAAAYRTATEHSVPLYRAAYLKLSALTASGMIKRGDVAYYLMASIQIPQLSQLYGEHEADMQAFIKSLYDAKLLVADNSCIAYCCYQIWQGHPLPEHDKECDAGLMFSMQQDAIERVAKQADLRPSLETDAFISRLREASERLNQIMSCNLMIKGCRVQEAMWSSMMMKNLPMKVYIEKFTEHTNGMFELYKHVWHVSIYQTASIITPCHALPQATPLPATPEEVAEYYEKIAERLYVITDWILKLDTSGNATYAINRDNIIQLLQGRTCGLLQVTDYAFGKPLKALLPVLRLWVDSFDDPDSHLPDLRPDLPHGYSKDIHIGLREAMIGLFAKREEMRGCIDDDFLFDLLSYMGSGCSAFEDGNMGYIPKTIEQFCDILKRSVRDVCIDGPSKKRYGELVARIVEDIIALEKYWMDEEWYLLMASSVVEENIAYFDSETQVKLITRASAAASNNLIEKHDKMNEDDRESFVLFMKMIFLKATKGFASIQDLRLVVATFLNLLPDEMLSLHNCKVTMLKIAQRYGAKILVDRVSSDEEDVDSLED